MLISARIYRAVIIGIYKMPHIIGILRRSELTSDRYDFRCRTDAFRGVSDEPSPPLRRTL